MGGHIFGTLTRRWGCLQHEQQGSGCERLANPQNGTGAQEFSWTFLLLQKIYEGVLLHCCPAFPAAAKLLVYSLVWTGECKSGFTALQRELVEARILAPPDPSLPFILDTDVSSVGSGVVLTQVLPKGESGGVPQQGV